MNIVLQNISRRNFIKATGLASTAPILWKISACSEHPTLPDIEFDSFISIHESFIEFALPRCEMGQDITTSFAVILAEELDCGLHNIKVKPAKADEALSPQLTVGSASIRLWHNRLTSIGAHLKAHILQIIQQSYQVQTDKIEIKEGIIKIKGSIPEPDKQNLYFDLLQKAPLNQAINSKSKPIDSYQLVGSKQTSINARAKVTGSFEYTNDMSPFIDKVPAPQRPLLAMTVAYKANWPIPNANELDEIKQAHNLEHTFILEEHISGFSKRAVLISDKQWRLLKAQKTLLERLNHHLKNKPKPSSSFESAYRDIQKRNSDQEFIISKDKIEAHFYTPELCHLPMETPTAIAYYNTGKLHILAPTQAPQHTRKRIAKKLGLKIQNINLQTVPMGGSFGRKRYSDFIEEAAYISKHIQQLGTPKPIKLLWSREDDIYRELYRPASIQTLSWSKSKKNTIKHTLIESTSPIHKASKSINRYIPFSTLTPETEVERLPGNHRTGIWRAVHHGYTAYAYNSFLDELCHHLDEDPSIYFTQHLESPSIKNKVLMSLKPTYHYNPERHKKTIERVKKMARWDDKRSQSKAIGFSSFYLFHSYASMVVELDPEAKDMTIKSIWLAVDCGTIINPDSLEAQLQGGICFALSACLFGQAPDSAENVMANYESQRLVRMNNMPTVQTQFEKNDYPPSGAGELAVPLVAPAVANAYRQLSGHRLCSMPFVTALNKQAHL